jgi:hypothetical protein
MLLKIKRSQKSSLMGKAVFGLSFRADVSKEELALIDKYKLGRTMVYSSEAFQKNAAIASTMGQGESLKEQGAGLLVGMKSLASALLFNLKVTIDDLIHGKYLEMKDLQELLSAEEQIVQACQNLKAYLEAAQGFDGREVVVEI